MTFTALTKQFGLLAALAMPAASVFANDPASVDSMLKAGEFLSAQQVAEQSNDQQAITAVAQAQAQFASHKAAEATLSQLDRTQQAEAVRQNSAERSLQGTGADFTELIQLIMTIVPSDSTRGGWEDDGSGDGAIAQFESGVKVDPNGVLSLLSRVENSRRLDDLATQARDSVLNDDLAMPAEMRAISLKQIQATVADCLADGQSIPESIRLLGGMYRITNVFVYPETNDIVIAGPAAGWKYNQQGWPVSTKNGQPVLQLDDLVVLMRAFAQDPSGRFGCSIDPQPERLQALQQFVAQSNQRGPMSPGSVRRWTKKMEETLGLQDVTLYGVPKNSRVARVMVEADYRMKLIGVGKVDGGENIPDYFSLLTREEQQSSKLDALRWWLAMNYEAVLQNNNHTAFEIKGDSVQCLSENQLLSADGQRIETGEAAPTNERFAARFSDHYSELAQRDHVFADLRNIFDLALVAAMIQHQGLADQAQFDLGCLATEGLYKHEMYPVPQAAQTIVEHRVFRGRDIVVQVAGGVSADTNTSVQQTKQSATLAPVAAPQEKWFSNSK